jgi:hypothetical protein
MKKGRMLKTDDGDQDEASEANKISREQFVAYAFMLRKRSRLRLVFSALWIIGSMIILFASDTVVYYGGFIIGIILLIRSLVGFSRSKKILTKLGLLNVINNADIDDIMKDNLH